MMLLGLTITVTAENVAWYAAIVATASALITAVSMWRDRASLIARISTDMVGVRADSTLTEGPYIQVTIANRGRRPIRIGTIGVKEHNTNHVNLLLDSSKRSAIEIVEGASHSELMQQDGVKLENGLVIMFDGTGREWVGRIKQNAECRLHCDMMFKKWIKCGYFKGK